MSGRDRANHRLTPSNILPIYWLVGAATGLALLHAGLALVWGPGPVIAVLPWYVPTMHSFAALAAASVAFLSFGRFRVLHELTPYWIALSFSAFAISAVFYVLSWPGLLPDERGLIAQLPNTAAWLWNLKFSAMALFFLAAVFVRQPPVVMLGERWWLWLAAVAVAGIAAIAILLVFIEQFLPLLVVDGVWTPLQIGWLCVLSLAFAAACVLSARRYHQTRDSLLGYAALTELTLFFGMLAVLTGGRRYDLWWYWYRVLMVGGFSAMLFGLLSEYVLLYRRERERTGEVEGLYAELDATISSIAEGIVAYCPSGEIIRMNPAAENILGYTPSERELSFAERVATLRVETAEGKPFPTEELPARRALRGETVHGVVMALHRPPDRAIWISTSAAPVRTRDGRLLGAVAVFTDITALHQLQEQREDLIRTVSHDLRSPLTIIQGQTQLLTKALEEAGLTGYELDRAMAIGTSAKRMNAMIQDLVDSIRLEAGQIRLEKRPVDLRSCVSDLLNRVTGVMDVGRVKLEIPADLPPVLADPDRLERILMNLLTNALKYSSPETEVLVEARKADGEVVTSVTDRGVGIAPEDLPHLFERFYRVAGVRKVEGLGLGLYITKMLVEAHGGRIWVESRVPSGRGKGSTFYFTLPLA